MLAKLWTVSSSKLKTYMECPAQYYWRYVAKKPADSKSVSIKLPKNGESAVVDTSDNNKDVRIEQEPSSIFDSGKLIHRVLEVAANKRISNATCDKKVTKKELLGLLESVASEPPTQDWQRPIVITPETIESAAKVLALCWKTISFPFTIKAEHKFDVPIGPVEDDNGNVLIEDVHLNGIIDRIDQFPNGKIKFVDYKSGWSVLSRTEAELDPQINLYLAVGKLLFPKAEIDMELRYLNRGIRLGPIHYTDARKDWLINGYVKPTLARMATWGKYPETPGSPQCYSCPRKSECASFASMVKGSLGPVTADMGQNLALYERLGEIEGNIEQLKGQIKPFINAAVEKADDGEIFAGNHRARVIFRNSTAYHDMKGTATAAAKAILEVKNASAPATTPVDRVAIAADALATSVADTGAADLVAADASVDVMKAAYAKLLEDNAKLKTAAVDASAAFKAVGAKLMAENAKLRTIAMESATAFEVACKISKAQAGLVNDFVEGLPEEVNLQVAQAIEGTATNAGFYMLEVERLAIPFHDRVPSGTDVEEAAKQDERKKLIPAGAKPIFDDAHEKTIEATVVERPKALEAPAQEAAVEPAPATNMEKAPELALATESQKAIEAPPAPKPVAKKSSKKESAAAKPVAAPVATPVAAPVAAPAEVTASAVAPAENMELFPSAEKSVVAEPQEIESVETPTKAEWAQSGCIACGGSGVSSRGSPCSPCVMTHQKAGVGV